MLNPDTPLQWAIFFLQLGTFIAVALYTLFTWKILKQSNKENALSTVLHLFEDIKNDYNGVEVQHPGNNEIVKHGYGGLQIGFETATDDILADLKQNPAPGYLSSFRLITTNYSSLINKLNLLNKGNKETLKPFIISFYKERLHPFVDKILAPYDKEQNRIEEESIKIFKQVRNQIKKIE